MSGTCQGACLQCLAGTAGWRISRPGEKPTNKGTRGVRFRKMPTKIRSTRLEADTRRPHYPLQADMYPAYMSLCRHQKRGVGYQPTFLEFFGHPCWRSDRAARSRTTSCAVIGRECMKFTLESFENCQQNLMLNGNGQWIVGAETGLDEQAEYKANAHACRRLVGMRRKK
jgi:hypothetical protein